MSQRTFLIFNPLTRQPWIGLEGESGGQGGVQYPAGVAAPESEDPGPITEETPETEAERKPEKTFTQEEMDAIFGKRLAKAERKWQRESRTTETPPPVSGEPLTLDQFATPEEYARNLAAQMAEQLDHQRNQQRKQTEVASTFAEREEDIRDKYPDYDQVAKSDNVRITNEMAGAILESEIGPEVAYHLGSNPKEALRISQLSPLRQAAEIGKIEAKLITEPPTKKTTSAPAPITPVSRSSSVPVYDTTDPRSDKALTTAQWIEAENKRELARYKAQHG